jgi:hypothetical protein
MDISVESTLTLLAIALLLIAVVFGSRYRARRVRAWCRAHKFELIDWYGAPFYEGPNRFWRSDNQDVVRVEVRDRDGLVRVGYLTFGGYWNPFSRKVEARWDGEP